MSSDDHRFVLDFQMVMEFLYHGGCATLKVNQSDVLELMAAANFFQLDGLLRFCEAQCSAMVDLDNIVSTYIHAKVKFCGQACGEWISKRSNIHFFTRSFFISRFTMRRNCWSIARAFCCKIWWRWWRTTIRWSVCCSRKSCQTTTSSQDSCWLCRRG